MTPTPTIDIDSFDDVAEVIWKHNPSAKSWAKSPSDITRQMLKECKDDKWGERTLLISTGGFAIALFRLGAKGNHFRAFVDTNLWRHVP